MIFVKYFLIILPILALAPMEVYFIDAVLKYRFKNRKLAYVVAAVLSVVTAAVTLAVCLDENGHIAMTISYDIVSIVSSLFILVLILLNMKEKLWKKLVVFFLTDMMLDTLYVILSSFREMLFISLAPESTVGKIVLNILMEIFVIAFELGLFILIDKFRSKHDNIPLPIPFLLALFFVVELFEFFFALQTTEYSADYQEYSELIDFSRLDVSQKATLVFTALIGLLAIIILFYVRATKKERDALFEMNRVNEELVASQTRYYEATVKADTEIRSIRHDMKNNIQVLKILLGNKEYDQMGDYLSEMTENLKTTEISAHTGDVIADAIISSKRAEAEAHGISLVENGVISGISITPQDMCKMLSNLLDNAIEAASDVRLRNLDPTFRKIILEFRKTDKFFLISVTNPCAEEVKIEDGMVKTSKEDFRNHGFGLKNIRSAAENYDGEFTISCEEKPYGFEFRADIMFPIIPSQA
ncbi:MAG: GHKL domain-containing protein [Clostridiales bacterium]|nr:GHKL domain-containing protein [Clostridiales bacterium]